MSRKKYFTDAEMSLLRQNPNVCYVRENRIEFTLEFRVAARQLLDNNKHIRNILADHGFDCTMLGCHRISNLKDSLLKTSKPTKGKYRKCISGLNRSTNKETRNDFDQELIGSGWFIKGRNGITFAPHLLDAIKADYGALSVEDCLIKHKIDIVKVGYQRIYTLERKLSGNCSAPFSSEIIYPENVIQCLRSHPYVSSITGKMLRLTSDFYQEASQMIDSIDISDILKIFEIQPTWINYSVKNSIASKLRNIDFYPRLLKKKTVVLSSEQISSMIQIQKNFCEWHQQRVDGNFIVIQSKLKQSNPIIKKKICLLIKELCDEQAYDHTSMSVSDWYQGCGLSKSSYYHIIRHSDYGLRTIQKEESDIKDFQVIKELYDYNGYHKGKRTLYMGLKMKGITFALSKIQRLMNKFNLRCPIRKENPNKRYWREHKGEITKSNVLKRKFRLARPYENLLTDITYLPGRDGFTAYYEPIKDGVTGRILASSLSLSLEQEIALSAVDELMDLHGDKLTPNTLLHSDQGVHYLNPTYQALLENSGIRQSMSRRGNCWDAAPMESYHSTVKDHIDFKSQKHFQDVQTLIKDFEYHYNYERPQWNRNRMTPVDYENYLLSLSPEKYEEYLMKEEKKYQRMMDKSKERLIKRAENLGLVFLSQDVA